MKKMYDNNKFIVIATPTEKYWYIENPKIFTIIWACKHNKICILNITHHS